MIRKITRYALITLALLASSTAPVYAEKDINVDVFKGETASVNSFIFTNGESLIVMDVQRSSDEAKKLAEVIKAKEQPLSHILITHGHPDHYIGMDHLLKTFPDAKIVVANEAIKKDIIGFSTWMETVGWLDAEPALKPKTDKNPDGFDYEANITALSDDSLKFNEGGELKLETNYLPAEANHATTVFVDSLNSFFMSDLGYNKVHLWMGQGVTDEHIQNWRDQLAKLKAKYGDRNPTLYPGHGDPTDMGLFDNMIGYMEKFQAITADAKSKEAAMAKMEKLYPDYKEAGFLLKHSVDFYVDK